MDVLKKKPESHYEDDLKKIIKLLTFKKNKIILYGSSSLSSQRYFSDYDLYCVLDKSNKSDFYKFLSELMIRLNTIKTDIWFIELKLYTKQGKKVRIIPGKKLSEAVYNKIYDKLAFVHIDLICRIDSIFTKVSCVYYYSLAYKEPNAGDQISSLKQSIKKLKKEHKYYRILKREFSIQKALGNKDELLRLSGIFNSDLGKEYKKISNLEALSDVLKYYHDPILIKKVMINLKHIHLPDNIEKIDDFITTKSKQLNIQAKKLL
jgi:hypothetical protein